MATKKKTKQPKKGIRKVATTIYLDDAQLVKLRKQSQTHGISQALIIRTALDEHLAKKKAA